MSRYIHYLQIKFGEPLSTDSEDFFADIAKFLAHFKRVTTELFPPLKVPTSVKYINPQFEALIQ